VAETLENAIHPKTRGAWRRWLAAHHARPTGVWLISYKQGTGKQQFDYNDAVEEALCFGWIDSKPKALDAERTMLWFSPRKPRSAWAASNKARIERLIAAGLMTEAGLVKIEAAKRDGSWNTLDSIDTLELPPDLRRAFRKHPGSAANFDAFPRGVKRNILQWISSAKRPETRAHRVEETAREAARNVRANQWRT
jgi:uncharacterized protein YdeI (YjbR/CyaY-like superfamily)